MNETMLRDIHSQDDALIEGLTSLRAQAAEIPVRGFDRIVLTGSGDSFIAAVALQQLFERHTESSVAALPSLDAARYTAYGPQDLLVAISVSGEVVRTIEAAGRAVAGHATTVAITADRGSTLGRGCHVGLQIPSPIDRSIPHSRDYTVTLLALACLLEQIAGVRLSALDDLHGTVRTTIERSFEMLGDISTASGKTWFLGAGPDRATAMFGALKFWEAAGLESWWDDLEEFAHGSQLMARPGDRAVLIAQDPGAQRASEMIDGLERMGLDVLTVGGDSMARADRIHVRTSGDLDPMLHPFIACIPLQVLAYVEAEARQLDVSVPLFGRPFGPTYDEVHTEWTRRSKLVLIEGSEP